VFALGISSRSCDVCKCKRVHVRTEGILSMQKYHPAGAVLICMVEDSRHLDARIPSTHRRHCPSTTLRFMRNLQLAHLMMTATTSPGFGITFIDCTYSLCSLWAERHAVQMCSNGTCAGSTMTSRTHPSIRIRTWKEMVCPHGRRRNRIP
jgi:hypothetical protein